MLSSRHHFHSSSSAAASAPHASDANLIALRSSALKLVSRIKSKFSRLSTEFTASRCGLHWSGNLRHRWPSSKQQENQSGRVSTNSCGGCAVFDTFQFFPSMTFGRSDGSARWARAVHTR